MRKKTYHQGAREERIAIHAKARRMARGHCDLADFITWLSNRVKRYKSRPGGL